MHRGPLVLVCVAVSGCFPTVDPAFKGDTGAGEDGGLDADGDGFAAAEDCDDSNAAVHPGAPEICDGLDNDCNGETDPDTAEGAVAWYIDADGDGYGDPIQTGVACEPPEGAVGNAEDCDDRSVAVYPGAPEICDAVDNDCDGLVDADDEELVASELGTFFADLDGDGWGDEDNAVEDCFAPEEYTANVGDCDDSRADVNPDAQEVCDDIDNDCDGLMDDEDPSNDPESVRDFYEDADGDGFGTGAWVFEGCRGTEGYAANDDDCDDADIEVHPASTEICDPLDVDEDCSGLADDADPGVDSTTATAWFSDEDGDGFGDNDSSSTLACDDPSTASASFAPNDTDCDDTDEAVNPMATEVCDDDNTDEDCDGLIDDADTDLDLSTVSTWTIDADEDGFGDSTASGVSGCDDPSTAADVYADNATDCDDTDSAVNPDAQEVCDVDDVDDDCDGLIDDADDTVDPSGTTIWYVDLDGDGYGDATDAGTGFCDDPSAGYAATVDDCDDTDAAVNPGATEVCNAVDDDCDASTSQDSMVQFVDSTGGSSDLSSSWAAGTSSSPVSWSSSGDGTLWVCADTWYVNLTISGDEVDIMGPEGASQTVLDGASDGAVASITSRSVVYMSGLTIQGGRRTRGGGLHIDSSTVDGDELIFMDNVASDYGGAVYAEDSNLSFSWSTFEGNEARSGGGLYIDGWGSIPILLDSCMVTDNLASSRGGGVYIKGSPEVALVDTELLANEAGEHGGGIYFDSGLLDLDTCAIELNVADEDGGGIFAKDDLYALDTTVDLNSAGDQGGGLYINIGRNEEVWLEGSIGSASAASSASVKNNSAGDQGDGVYIKIGNHAASGILEADVVDFDTDEVFHNTRSNGTLSPGDGATVSCDFSSGCY